MAEVAKVRIDLDSKADLKGFKQVETASQKLTKSAKKLGGALGLAFGTTAILAYGKAAVKAAAADEKAQKQLALALKNVGLGRDAASSEEYIQALQSEFGIVDDLLRPAYQTLAVATRDSEQAQKLFNLSLDISASTGRDLGSVTGALSKAFLGNNTALSKLGVGISKADLKAGKFDDIVDKLTTTFAGSATAAANTFQGSIDKLGVASANVQEIIGTGLIDALTGLGKDTSIAELASNMEKTATYLADVIRGVGILSSKLKDIPVLGGLNVGMIPIVGSYIELLRKAGTQTAELKSADNAHLQSLQSAYKISTKTLTNSKALTKETAAQLKAAKLKLAVEKANAALGAGADFFDMDQIQIAAALANQAEQLGKATSSAQQLAIANDVARLNVKKSMYDLEQAIAAGDVAAIEAATAKLNADLGVLNALTGQNAQLLAIKSILEGLKPKALIDQANLDQALATIRDMIAALANFKLPTSASLGSGIPANDYIAPIPMSVGLGASTAALIEASEAAQERADAFATLLDMQTEADLAAFDASPLAASVMPANFDLEDVARKSLLAGLTGGAGVAGAVSGSRYAAQAANQYNITVNAGVVGSEEVIVSAVQNALQTLNRRGDPVTTAGSV